MYEIPVSPEQFLENLRSHKDYSDIKKIHHSIEGFVARNGSFDEEHAVDAYNAWAEENRSVFPDLSCEKSVAALSYFVSLAGCSQEEVRESFLYDEQR